MATLTLRPSGVGSETSIPNSSGEAEHYMEVDEAVCDGVTTYVADFGAAPQAYKRDLYLVPDHTTESGVINSVKIYFCVLGGSNGTVRHRCYTPCLKSNSTVTDGTEVDAFADSGYNTYSQTWATNPADSAAWEWADIDALEIGIGVEKKDAGSPVVSQVYAEVDYTPGTIVTPPTLSLTDALYKPILKEKTTPITLSLSDTQFVPILKEVTTPTTLSLTDTHYVPVLKEVLTPGLLALSDTEYAPILKETLTPGLLALIDTEYAPVLDFGIIVDLLGLSLTEYVPILEEVLTPGLLALIDTEYIPTITIAAIITPSVLSLILTTYAPDLYYCIWDDHMARVSVSRLDPSRVVASRLDALRATPSRSPLTQKVKKCTWL